MQCSFSFCGKNVEDIGLKYAPDNADTYVYATSTYNVAEQDTDSQDGGHFYGATLKTKQFVLRCYYENTHVSDGLMSRIQAMFKRGRTGKLVFSNRPWLYYIATVTSLDVSRMINSRNGIVTIQMKAYYPYALTDYTLVPNDENQFDIASNSALFETAIAPVTTFNSLTSQTTILLYNGGTERASVNVGIAGNVGTGISIYNRTTKQECDFVGLNGGSSSHYVICNGRTGNVYWSDTGENAFIYHDGGFIELEPSYPIDRTMQVSVASQGTTVTAIYGSFDSEMIGKYIYLDGAFRKIVNVTSETELTVNATIQPIASVNSPVVTMNEIVITPKSDMNLSLLKFDYKHTFA